MIRSMTGYCSLRETIDDSPVLMEIKTLNHKGFDFHFYASRSISMLEMPMREFVRARISRGRIEVYIKGGRLFMAGETIRPNFDAARQYLDAARSLSAELDLPHEPSVNDLLTKNGVLEIEDESLPMDECWKRLQDLAGGAVNEVLSMKVREGRSLESELNRRLDQVERLRGEIAELRPSVIGEYREKLLERVREWSEKIELDESRVMQEIALYTDRSDIQEELVRLESHIVHFREAMEQNRPDAEYAPIGRRLDFLCQEMFREVNTIGSKSSSMDIGYRVVDLKTAVEQIREQVQNIE